MRGERSRGEAFFKAQCALRGLPEPMREHRFHPVRKWRFDFAWPDRMLAVEIEGGAFSGGRHTRGVGFQSDCEKYNAAVLSGWRVFRFTSQQVMNGAAVAIAQQALCQSGVTRNDLEVSL